MNKDSQSKLEKIMSIKAFMQRAPKIMTDASDVIYVQIPSADVWWLLETLEKKLRKHDES